MDDNWMEGRRREEVRMRRRNWKGVVGGLRLPLSPSRQNIAVIFITAPIFIVIITILALASYTKCKILIKI